MTEHEYTDTYCYKKEEKEKQSRQKQDGMKKSLYVIVSVLVAVIGSICFFLAALLYLFSNIVDLTASVYRRISSRIRTPQNTVSKKNCSNKKTSSTCRGTNLKIS